MCETLLETLSVLNKRKRRKNGLFKLPRKVNCSEKLIVSQLTVCVLLYVQMGLTKWTHTLLVYASTDSELWRSILRAIVLEHGDARFSNTLWLNEISIFVQSHSFFPKILVIRPGPNFRATIWKTFGIFEIRWLSQNLHQSLRLRKVWPNKIVFFAFFSPWTVYNNLALVMQRIISIAKGDHHYVWGKSFLEEKEGLEIIKKIKLDNQLTINNCKMETQALAHRLTVNGEWDSVCRNL